MLGIPNYKPNFHTSAADFKNAFNATLFELIGKRIEKFWVMWNTKQNEWFNDGPIVLEIDGKRYEFTAFQLDEFSLTIDTFNLKDKLDWYGMGDDLPLIWKENGNSDLAKNLNKNIVGINILTFNFISEDLASGEEHETGAMLNGIEFVLEKESPSDIENFFSIFNALDQNGLDKVEIRQENQIQRIKITNGNNDLRQ
ncbi:hypothetical protein [Flavobacterium cerinum]|uniref:Uncharacterized protein n=1 Tax=Flavobacterium cerinum TaxID=2502784 RepID=A0ABY5IQL1_9FLAO|nr:hypothetical protein [Flavobacterium cerinum]UUC45135.1 hypothetical protein NOX80_16110 [Flavobacterium cerinum]